MNLLNEEIRCLKTTIAEKKKIMNEIENINVKSNLELEIKILEKILDDKLEEADFL